MKYLDFPFRALNQNAFTTLMVGMGTNAGMIGSIHSIEALPVFCRLITSTGIVHVYWSFKHPRPVSGTNSRIPRQKIILLTSVLQNLRTSRTGGDPRPYVFCRMSTAVFLILWLQQHRVVLRPSASGLTAFFPGFSSFLRTPFVRNTLFMSGTSALTGDFLLFFHIHRSKSSDGFLLRTVLIVHVSHNKNFKV